MLAPRKPMITLDQDMAKPYFLDLLDIDYRAEILAAALLDNLLTEDQLLIQPTGLLSRSFSKDITSFDENIPVGESGQLYTRISTPRESLYDMFPHFLFREPHPIQDIADTETILKDIRDDQLETTQGHLFFLPFDSELLQLRALAVNYDNAIDRLEDAQVLFRPFSEHWPILHEMTIPQRGLFLQILPWLHSQRRNLPWLAEFLTLFFEVPVSVTAGRYLKKTIRGESLPCLSDCRLGIDAVVGSEFDDQNNGILVVLGTICGPQIPDFLPHASNMVLLQKLLSYFLPAATEFSVIVKTAPSAPDAPSGDVTYLGYSAFL